MNFFKWLKSLFGRPRTERELCFHEQDGATTFERIHDGGVIQGKLKGKNARWKVSAIYQEHFLGSSSFRKLRHGEDWARGKIRKAKNKYGKET